MAEDNWQHRSTSMGCKSCMWFQAKEGKVEGLGRCRRHAPCITVIGWPAVFETDWCGDHKIDENASG